MTTSRDILKHLLISVSWPGNSFNIEQGYIMFGFIGKIESIISFMCFKGIYYYLYFQKQVVPQEDVTFIEYTYMLLGCKSIAVFLKKLVSFSV